MIVRSIRGFQFRLSSLQLFQQFVPVIRLLGPAMASIMAFCLFVETLSDRSEKQRPSMQPASKIQKAPE